MSDVKISALTSGDPAQSTDQVPVVRSGANLRVSVSTIQGVASFNTRTGAISLTQSDVDTAFGYTPENAAHKDQASGYPSLDGNGLVPVTEIPGNCNVNAQGSSTSAYTALLTDAGNLVTMDPSGAGTFTIPPNSGVAFRVGTTLSLIQLGGGQITLTPGAGVTLYTSSSLTTRTQYSVVSMTQVSANVWVASGDLS